MRLDRSVQTDAWAKLVRPEGGTANGAAFADSLKTMRRLVVAFAAALVVVPAAWAQSTPTAPVYDSKGHLVQTPYAPANAAMLTKKKASDIFLHDHKVASWLKHYPRVVTYD